MLKERVGQNAGQISSEEAQQRKVEAYARRQAEVEQHRAFIARESKTKSLVYLTARREMLTILEVKEIYNLNKPNESAAD